MDTDPTRTSSRTLLRAVPIASVALFFSMGLLYATEPASGSGYDVTQHTITITTHPPAGHASHTMSGMSHEHGGLKSHYDEGVWGEAEFTVQDDMWLTEFSTEFTGVSIHNFYVFVKGTHDAWCPSNPSAIYSGGTVSARQPLIFDAPYGVFVKKGTTLVLKAFYHETAGSGEEKTPTFSVHARYELATDTNRSVPITLHFVMPEPCEYTRPVFTVPPHAENLLFSSDKRPFVFHDDGVILKAMGHFHAAYTKGVSNTLRLLLNGKQIDSFTTTNVGDEAARNPKLLAGRLVSVHRGDILSVHAIFSNPSAEPVAEGMAIVGFYFAPLSNK